MNFQLLLILIAGHYLADFSLQTRFMSNMKGKIFIDAMGLHSLNAHAAVQGLVIGLLSQSFMAGLVVAITHWIIDFVRASEWLKDKLFNAKIIKSKPDKLLPLHIDQLLHFVVLVIIVWRLS